jgi:hypothetical protein
MIQPIDDALVDNINVSPAPVTSLEAVDVVAPPDLIVVKHLLQPFAWRHLGELAEYVRDAISWGHEIGDFRFSDDLEPGEDSFDGVQLSDPIHKVVVTRAAFDRLMIRYFDAIIHGAHERNLPVLHEPWWAEFLSNVEVIRSRVAGTGGT